MPKFEWVGKVLVLGSGAIKIAEAGEFDYSGSQCLKACREEGVETVLVNPNVATIQTDPRLADKVYLLPVTAEFVEKLIERERPDGLMVAWGGQTALNCAVELAKKGVLEKYGVKILGTQIDGIIATEDRGAFRNSMISAGIKVPHGEVADSVEKAVEIANLIGYPVMVRAAYALGGKTSGVAYGDNELIKVVGRALSHCPQVIVEEYIGGWKEVEYEVMRDWKGNSVVVCNMENVDPMGIHTGDSIVVAPSQTLDDYEYNFLREISIRAAGAVGVIGECNVQLALDEKYDYRVIEINARLSRSSALASKATGYPIAYIAAKIALGYSLPELMNKITGMTTACFEPSLDYVVVKIPRWDFQKFRKVDPHIGSQMKSIGEVMAVGRTFEEAIQKAVRMLDIGKIGLTGNEEDSQIEDLQRIEDQLRNPTDKRLFYIVKALKMGMPVDRICKLTRIDKWFILKIKRIVDFEGELEKTRLTNPDILRNYLERAKKLGFSDFQIAKITGLGEEEVRSLRRKFGIVPVTKRIDSLAAEWPAKTNYLYLTYGGDEDEISYGKEGGLKKVVVLGSGPYRIGSSVEFDWCCVNTVWSLKKNGVDQAIIVNCNPETVSTDYDVSDKLYFEELTYERILDIYEKERPSGVVVSMGGQISNNVALKLSLAGVKLIGTRAENIDKAEDRSKFSLLLNRLGVKQPEWRKLTSIEEALEFAGEIGYPVLVRPSYVLSGEAMRVAYTPSELINYLALAAKVSGDHPVVISRFFEEAMEAEVDGVSDGDEALIGAIIEHIDEAGIHSGDSTMIIPPQNVSEVICEKIIDYSKKIAKALRIKGPFNIQFLIKNDDVYVIECNLRASRTMPFTSKATGLNLIELAVPIMLGRWKLNRSLLADKREIKHVSVKSPQFSFMRLSGADPKLGVEMASTGEVACISETFSDALIKSMIASEQRIPMRGNILILGKAETKLFDMVRGLGYRVMSLNPSKNCCDEEKAFDKAMKSMVSGKINLLISVPSKTDGKLEYLLRRAAIDFNVPLITSVKVAESIFKSISNLKSNGSNFSIKSLNEHLEKLTWTYGFNLPNDLKRGLLIEVNDAI